MITINIICVGNLKERYWRDACGEYSKRLSSFCKFNIIEIPECRLPENPSQSQIENTLDDEGKRILDKIPRGSKVYAMCIEAKEKSSEELAADFANIAVSGYSSISFVIGGSWGLSKIVKDNADYKISMSKMTFPHQLARVMLCEQIYRAFQINNGGKYHK